MSNESKYTPGPWVGIGRSIYAESNMDQPFAMVAQREKSGEQCAANVALIAAAPEMLELFERIMGVRDLWYPGDDYPQHEAEALASMDIQIRNIIKKAKGE